MNKRCILFVFALLMCSGSVFAGWVNVHNKSSYVVSIKNGPSIPKEQQARVSVKVGDAIDFRYGSSGFPTHRINLPLGNVYIYNGGWYDFLGWGIRIPAIPIN